MAGTLNVKVKDILDLSLSSITTSGDLLRAIEPLRKEYDIIVASISLGSTRRDKVVELDFREYRSLIFRKGTNGNFQLAAEMIERLDGLVDSIGLGGIDLYIRVGDQVFTIEDALELAKRVKTSLVVDGSDLKDTLERKVIRELTEDGVIRPPQKVLMVSSVDRWGMAETFWELGYRCLFGDLIFSLGINHPLSSIDDVKRLGKFILKYVTKMPFEFLYPVGEKQHKYPKSLRYSAYYEAADIIAGDFHYVIKYMPLKLEGKTVITNTLTQEDIEDLKRRGVTTLVTTTPKLGGRSFGTNVMEGLIKSYYYRLYRKPLRDKGELLKIIDDFGLSYTKVF